MKEVRFGKKLIFILLPAIVFLTCFVSYEVKAGIGEDGRSVFDGGWYDVWPYPAGTIQIGAFYTTGGWTLKDGEWTYLPAGVYRIYKTIVSFPDSILDDYPPIIIVFQEIPV
ncbi:MAG: hypothetical protein QXX20_05960 [Candidatus Thermoplasmatota archaeon]